MKEEAVQKAGELNSVSAAADLPGGIQTSIIVPVKPKSERNLARPRRNRPTSAARPGSEVTPSAQLPPVKVAMMKSKPPLTQGVLFGKSSLSTPRHSKTSATLTFRLDESGENSAAARESSLARGYEALGVEMYQLDGDQPNRFCSRPASHSDSLPPVTPPSRRPVSRSGSVESRSFFPGFSAMAMDLGIDTPKHAAPTQTHCGSKPSATFKFTKQASKQDMPWALPPIHGGAKGLLEAKKHRSSSMGSMLWGVAPLDSSSFQQLRVPKMQS